MKILFLLLDGYGDMPCKELDGKTPSEAAKTPNLDKLASSGTCGMLIPEGLGNKKSDAVPLSSASLMLFSILGYDARGFKPSRGVVEAVGARMNVKEGDLCARCNFATVEEVKDNWKIVDLRAGRVKNTKVLEYAINSMDFIVPFEFKATHFYRGVLVLKAKDKEHPLDDKISEVDPHKVGANVKTCVPLSKKADYTAYLINQFMKESHKVLSEHLFNENRDKPANFLLMRGFGNHVPKLEPFSKKFGMKACGITGLDVNKGVVNLLGMDLYYVPEEISRDYHELEIKTPAIEKALEKYDFVFVHFKNTDDPGHDGDVEQKVHQIELVDKFIGTLDLKDKLVVVTSDHCTPCKLKAHSADPIPTLISPAPQYKFRRFSEKECTDFSIPSYKLMEKVLGLAKR